MKIPRGSSASGGNKNRSLKFHVNIVLMTLPATTEKLFLSSENIKERKVFEGQQSVGRRQQQKIRRYPIKSIS
jgi:hypothetical protein